MAIVKKANKVLTVQENAVESYLKRGYDEINEKGEIIKRATGGKVVSIAEHNKVLDELEALKAENEKLKAKKGKEKADK